MTLEVLGTRCIATCSPQFDEAGKLEFVLHTLAEIPGLATTKVEALQETDHRSTLRKADLRRKAEVIAQAHSAGSRKAPGRLNSGEAAQMLHELGVHQIELEMQNEELRISTSLLDASRAKYFSFYDLAPVGYLTLSAGGSILESNLTASTMLGEARNVLLARPFKRYILKEDLGDYYLFRKRLSESNDTLALELRMVKMDGTAFWAELNCAMVSDAQGARTCRVVMSDISDRKRDEEALRASESSLRAIFENSLESFMVIDGDQTIQSFNRVANERVKTVFGIELHQGDSIYRTVMQKDRESFDRDFARAMRGETVCVERSFEAVPDMYWFEFHYAPVRSEAGRISGVFFSVHDITERKRAESALRKSTELLSLFIRASPVLSYIKSVTASGSRVLLASESFLQLIGIPSPEISGKTMEELFPADFAAKISIDDREVVLGGSVLETEEEWNGRSYSTTKFPIKQDGETMLAGFSIDITERKLAEEKIKTLLAEKELILKEVHHRIKNNMSTVCSFLTLKVGVLKDPSAIEALETAALQVQGMMLLYDKLYQSEGFIDLSVRDYLPHLVDQILANFPAGRLVRVEKDIGDFVLDAKRLQPISIMLNELLTNIMKYAFVGRDDGVVSVSATLKDGLVRLEVADNGRGIPEGIDFTNSTGFGLTLVRGLAEQLNGSLRLVRGKGTRFILELRK
ncbi:MAG: PAS domain S-box protein [Spirochaetota bacterium]